MALKAATNGICESFMAFNTNYNDTGLFGVYSVCKPENVEDMGWLVMNECTRCAPRRRPGSPRSSH